MARPGFSFLVCPDSVLLKEEMLRQIGAAGEDPAKWKRHVFWGDEEPGAPFWEALIQGGLFAESRLVVARQAEGWPAAVWSELSTALAKERPNIWPFFCIESEWAREPKMPPWIQKARCYRFAEKKGWVWKKSGLGQGIWPYARDQARKLGLAFSPEAKAAFLESGPKDACGIMNELRRLALLAKDGLIEDAHLSGGARPQADVFKLASALNSGDLPTAMGIAGADADGSLLFGFLAVYARQLSTLWSGAPGGFSRPGLAARLGPEGIGTAMALLVDAEWQVKSGRMQPPQALESLCAKLAALLA